MRPFGNMVCRAIRDTLNPVMSLHSSGSALLRHYPNHWLTPNSQAGFEPAQCARFVWNTADVQHPAPQELKHTAQLKNPISALRCKSLTSTQKRSCNIIMYIGKEKIMEKKLRTLTRVVYSNARSCVRAAAAWLRRPAANIFHMPGLAFKQSQCCCLINLSRIREMKRSGDVTRIMGPNDNTRIRSSVSSPLS